MPKHVIAEIGINHNGDLDKAKMLIKKYGSLMEIGDCDKKELCSLEGIGDKTADRILSVFNSEKKVKQ